MAKMATNAISYHVESDRRALISSLIPTLDLPPNYNNEQYKGHPCLWETPKFSVITVYQTIAS